ncbi:MAG: glycoside hydrolase family 9 protein [Bacteroidota bacterium]
MKTIVLLLIYLLPFVVYAQNDGSDMLSGTGVLYSRVGYNSNAQKRIILRDSLSRFSDSTTFTMKDAQGRLCYSGALDEWGKKWSINWWIADFTELEASGDFTFELIQDSTTILNRTIKVQPNILWKATWRTVALDQLKGRIDLRNQNLKKYGPEYAQGGGWQDCGSYLREVNSHATMIVGLLDVLEFAADRITAAEKQELVAQIVLGLDYIAFCQDKAEELGRGAGAILHEWPRHTNVITGDVAKGALCFARAGHLLQSLQKDKAEEYKLRAIRSFDWLQREGPIHHPGGTDFNGVVQPNDGYEPKVYGAPQGATRPDEWKTRDIVMMMWTAMELSKSGQSKYKALATNYADLLMKRQIDIRYSEGRFYGHFKAFDSTPFTEKAWEHHHMGFDAGSTFPHYLIPLIQMIDLWSDHQDIEKWKECVQSFAYGYLLPACSNNPFKLLPMGYFEGEGLLNFSGLWHGMNGAYGSAAALALELFNFTGDQRFKEIATGNLQWIAGLNAGVPENGQYESKSMIYGVGEEYVGSWTKIAGTICNGFEADGQFAIEQPRSSTDGPFVFTDEGWITHAGGWLSAISRWKME